MPSVKVDKVIKTECSQLLTDYNSQNQVNNCDHDINSFPGIQILNRKNHCDRPRSECSDEEIEKPVFFLESPFV